MKNLQFFASDLHLQLRMIDHLKSEIHKLWFINGDITNEHKAILNQCPRLKSLMKDELFLSCNDLLLQCYLEHKIEQLKQNSIEIVRHDTGDLYHMVAAADMTKLHFHQVDGVRIELKLTDKELSPIAILLERSCHQKMLPQKIYRTSVKENWLWDNFNREIWIDKFLINQMWLGQWAKQHKVILDHIDLSQANQSALGLTLAQQRKVCEFRGGRVIDLLTYEAMIFYPTSWDDPALRDVKHYTYPWGRDKRINPFKNQTPSFSDCSLVFSQNCKLRGQYNPWETNNISWMGTYQILGGPMESIENPFGAPLVKLSSYHYPHKSEVHKNAVYANWNGIDHSLTSPTKIERRGRVEVNEMISTDKNVEIGFRCIREY